MLDFCLLHYLLSSDSEAMTLHKCHHSIHYFSKPLAKNKLVLYWIILRVIPLGLALLYIQVLPSDIGEYLSSLFNTVVVVVFISIFTLELKNVSLALQILLSERKFTDLLTYFVQYKHLKNGNEKCHSKLIW